jgi:hypothetical protein
LGTILAMRGMYEADVGSSSCEEGVVGIVEVVV